MRPRLQLEAERAVAKAEEERLWGRLAGDVVLSLGGADQDFQDHVGGGAVAHVDLDVEAPQPLDRRPVGDPLRDELGVRHDDRSEEHTSELQSQSNLVCRLLLEKKKTCTHINAPNSLVNDSIGAVSCTPATSSTSASSAMACSDTTWGQKPGIASGRKCPTNRS